MNEGSEINRDLTRLSNDELADLCADECAFEEQVQGRVRLELSFIDALGLVSQVQLALRHPGNTGASREQVEDAIRDFSDDLSEGHPYTAEVIRRGWAEVDGTEIGH